MADMVQMGVMHAMATGVMRDVYCNWICIPKPDQSWNHWKKHFNDALNKIKELNTITVESMGYSASNITEQTVAIDVVMVLDNLAFAAMS